ncbi:MAG: hypothetical protein GY708_27865 [Actinomycetia bacterium]|nr:hypothetical protein [Actinomycetes bacterium]MCP4961699.1 hypothetical protein [Actinomycetes bacterium]
MGNRDKTVKLYNERGSVSAEYALLLTGIAVAIAAIVFALGGRIEALYTI